MADAQQTAPPPAPPAAPARRGFRIGLRVRFTVYLAAFLLAIMGIASYLVIQQQRDALDKEVRERGLALARALAANSVEPLSLGEAQLPLMLLVKAVIQSSDESDAGARRLQMTESLGTLVWRYVLRFGIEENGVRMRNEGVLFARIVDPTGKKIAVADAQMPPEKWLEETDQPYQPPATTTLLSPGEDERIWESPDFGGIYVIAVPIHQRQAVARNLELPEGSRGRRLRAGRARSRAPRRPPAGSWGPCTWG
jgi:hypothetical protein